MVIITPAEIVGEDMMNFWKVVLTNELIFVFSIFLKTKSTYILI